MGENQEKKEDPVIGNSQGFGFPKALRIRKSAEFSRVYQGSVYAADHVLVIQGIPGSTDHCRLGISVSRKVGNAVVRNRWKRLLRESFRLNQSEFPVSVDLVVRPRKGAQPEFHAIQESLIRLYRKIRRRLEQIQS